MKDPKDKKTDPVIATHHQARRDYEILESLETGLVLTGSEVKSLRDHQASFNSSFARIDGGELFLYNLYIAPYDKAGLDAPEPSRQRKLLVHKQQLDKLAAKTQEKGLVLVPLTLYFNDRGIAKLELGVGRGKKHQDRRADIKERSIRRDIDRAIKSRNRK